MAEEGPAKHCSTSPLSAEAPPAGSPRSAWLRPAFLCVVCAALAARTAAPRPFGNSRSICCATSVSGTDIEGAMRLSLEKDAHDRRDVKRLLRAPEVTFDSAELGMEEFGFNILNSDLNTVLEKKCAAQANLTVVLREAVQTAVSFGARIGSLSGDNIGHRQSSLPPAWRLLPTAAIRLAARDCRELTVKRWSYPQVAVVLNLEHRLPHQHVSTEFHTSTGPFTLVPLPGRQVGARLRRNRRTVPQPASDPRSGRSRTATWNGGPIRSWAPSSWLPSRRVFRSPGMNAETLVAQRLVPSSVRPRMCFRRSERRG